MIGLAVMIGQSALFGLLALWLGSRLHRAWRIFGGLLLLATGWMSVVSIINRLGGDLTTRDFDSNILIITASALGWLAGMNKRLRPIIAQPGYLGRSRLVFDGAVRKASLGIEVLAAGYWMVGGAFALLAILPVVHEVAGFWGVLLSIVFAPIALPVALLYAGFGLHTWAPAALLLGCGFAGSLEWWFGRLVWGKTSD